MSKIIFSLLLLAEGTPSVMQRFPGVVAPAAELVTCFPSARVGHGAAERKTASKPEKRDWSPRKSVTEMKEVIGMNGTGLSHFLKGTPLQVPVFLEHHIRERPVAELGKAVCKQRRGSRH